MSIELPILKEIHSSDISAACLRQVRLRHEGKVVGQMTGALYRGSLFHELAAIYYTTEGATIPAMIAIAEQRVIANAAKENRPLSDATRAGMADTRLEVSELFAAYIERCAVPRERVIGVEVPMRWTMTHPSLTESVEFATHADLIYRGEDGGIVVRDYKTGKESPSFEYLIRNYQFMLMACIVQDGEVMMPDWGYQRMDAIPTLEWLHVNDLKPYSQKGSAGEGDYKRCWVKGDLRPLDNIIRRVTYTDEGLERGREELALRAAMIRANHFPMIPDAIGCGLCESRSFCPSFVGTYSKEVL